MICNTPAESDSDSPFVHALSVSSGWLGESARAAIRPDPRGFACHPRGSGRSGGRIGGRSPRMVGMTWTLQLLCRWDIFPQGRWLI